MFGLETIAGALNTSSRPIAHEDCADPPAQSRAATTIGIATCKMRTARKARPGARKTRKAASAGSRNAPKNITSMINGTSQPDSAWASLGKVTAAISPAANTHFACLAAS